MLFRWNGTASLADFGMAREYGSDTLTSELGNLGSLVYISTQQRRAPHEATTADDVFSVGQVLFHAITGVVPHGNIGEAIVHRSDVPLKVGAFIWSMRSYERWHRPTALEVSGS